METILALAQELVYVLSSLMPTPYQKDNLEAMLALFLEAQGHSIPEHSKTKSASALSRFLNINRWSTRSCIRTVRNHIPPIPHPQLSDAFFRVGGGASIPQVLSKNTQN